jgi:hypothetical protein
MIGQGCAGRLPAREALDRHAKNGGLADCSLGGNFILGRGGDQILELQFHLVDQVLLAFGGLAPLRLAGFGNAQLEIFDDGLGIGELGLCDGGIGLRDGGLPALCQQRCAERFDVVRKVLDALAHRGKLEQKSANRSSKNARKWRISATSIRQVPDGKYAADYASRWPPAETQAALPRWKLPHPRPPAR